MSLMDKFKDFIRKTFVFKRHVDLGDFTIDEAYSCRQNMVKNKIIMRGIPSEIEELYKKMDSIPGNSFWRAKSRHYQIYKSHSGIPYNVVKMLEENTLQEFNYIEIKDNEGNILRDYTKIWDNVIENNLDDLLEDLLLTCLGQGDGAIRLIVEDGRIKIDFVEGLNVEFDDEKILFKDIIKEDGKEFVLISIYEPGKISYKLYNAYGQELTLNALEKTRELKDVEFIGADGKRLNVNLAIKTILFKSKLFKGRGGSVCDSKEMIIDAIDEIYSTLIQDGVRNSRVSKYMPYSMLPTNDDGDFVMNNDFVNQFIGVNDNAVVSNENYQPRIDVVQPQIDVERFEKAFKFAVNLFIADWANPSSLNLDENLVVNTATEIKMRERVTIETIQNIEIRLNQILEDLIISILQVYYLINFDEEIDVENINIEVDWSEIGAPTFGEIIDVLTKAAPGKQILTYEDIAKQLKPKATIEEQEKYAKELEALNSVEDIDYMGYDEDIDENMSNIDSNNLTNEEE